MLISSTLVKVQITVMCGVQCKVMNAVIHIYDCERMWKEGQCMGKWSEKNGK